METHSSRMSVTIQQSTWCHVPEAWTLPRSCLTASNLECKTSPWVDVTLVLFERLTNKFKPISDIIQHFLCEYSLQTAWFPFCELTSCSYFIDRLLLVFLVESQTPGNTFFWIFSDTSWWNHISHNIQINCFMLHYKFIHFQYKENHAKTTTKLSKDLSIAMHTLQTSDPVICVTDMFNLQPV
jgi:hypothetical protein